MCRVTSRWPRSTISPRSIDSPPTPIMAIQPAYEIDHPGTRRLLQRIAGLAGPAVDILLPNVITVRPVADLADPRLADVDG